MKKPLKYRFAKKIKLNFKYKNKIIKFDYKSFCKKFKIHEVIKCTNKEFKCLQLQAFKKNFNHFNIFDSTHKRGKKYLMIKIEKKGISKNNKHILPILSYKTFYLGKCLGVKNNVNYDNLKLNDYKNNLYKAKSVKDLKRNLLLKYNSTLKHLSNKDKIKLGVGITKIKIIDKHENY